MAVPPYDTNGNTIPVIGNKYTEAPKFKTDWKSIHAPKPEINIFLNSFFSLTAIKKKVIMHIERININIKYPMKPYSSPIIDEIKSE